MLVSLEPCVVSRAIAGYNSIFLISEISRMQEPSIRVVYFYRALPFLSRTIRQPARHENFVSRESLQ
jgi:hypothetical protein